MIMALSLGLSFSGIYDNEFNTDVIFFCSRCLHYAAKRIVMLTSHVYIERTRGCMITALRKEKLVLEPVLNRRCNISV